MEQQLQPPYKEANKEANMNPIDFHQPPPSTLPTVLPTIPESSDNIPESSDNISESSDNIPSPSMRQPMTMTAASTPNTLYELNESSDNIPSPSMRQPMTMTAASTPKTLYKLNNPKVNDLVYYFIDDNINTPPKMGNITKISSWFGKKYTVKSGKDTNIVVDKVDKVYTSNQELGKGNPPVKVVQVVVTGGGRRRKSKKVFKNKNKKRNSRKSRKSRKSSKRSRRY